MPHLGIAVATTLGGWLNAGLLYATLAARRLRRRRAARARPAPDRAGQPHHGRGAVVVAAMLAPCSRRQRPACRGCGAMAALVGAGLVVYVVAIVALGAIDLRQLRALLRRDGRPAAPRELAPALAPLRPSRHNPRRSTRTAMTIAEADPARVLRHAADRQPAPRQLSGRHGALGGDAEEPRVHLLHRRHARDHAVAGPRS